MSGNIVNTHWFGGVDKLPPNTVYIGRGGPHGNPFSSKDGKFSKEDCVALHRVDLNRQLVENPSYKDALIAELDGKDLACWCAQPSKNVACHGRNFLHMFEEPFRSRTYTEPVLVYLVEDLRNVLSKIDQRLKDRPVDEHYLDFYLALAEVRLDITEVFRLFAERETPAYLRCVWTATFVIDLELALEETEPKRFLYRMDRVIWNTYRFTVRPESRADEPSDPDVKIRKPKKKEHENV